MTAGGTVVFLILLEIGLRLGGNIFISIQEFKNLKASQRQGDYRVLCLGESTTQGQYPAILEKILNQNDKGIHFSVIDKGRTGTTSPAIVDEVGSYIAEYHPNMVIAMMGINDKRIKYYQDIPDARSWIFRECHVYRLLRILWVALRKKIEMELGSSSAEDSFKRALLLDPRNDRSYAGLGRLYRDQEKFRQAEIYLKKAIEFNPWNSNAQFELGQTYRSRGKYPEAEEAFKKALALNPKSRNAFIGLGLLYREQRKFPEQTEAFLKKAIALSPGNDSALLIELGRFYREQNQLLRAEEAFKAAVAHNPRSDKPYLVLGDLYRFEGQWPLAKAQFQKAVTFNPQSDRAIGAMISLHEEIGEPLAANDWAERAMTSGSSDYSMATANSYQRLKEILDRKKIRLVCVQYPLRNILPLEKMFPDVRGIIFVDNSSVFRRALKQNRFKDLFTDMFAGDFGHCTQKGNEILAKNIANEVLAEVLKEKQENGR